MKVPIVFLTDLLGLVGIIFRYLLPRYHLTTVLRATVGVNVDGRCCLTCFINTSGL